MPASPMTETFSTGASFAPRRSSTHRAGVLIADRASQQLNTRTDVGQYVIRGAVGLAEFDLWGLRLLPGADPVEQLSEQAERVDLIVVGRRPGISAAGPQVRKPWCALAHVEAEHRHAPAHRLRPHRLVAAAHELLTAGIGLPLLGPPFKIRAHARK